MSQATHRALILLALVFGATPSPCRAMVDEAHSVIMDVATPYVEDGFNIRADYWNGVIETGEQKLIRHQLFRGNEYWFWVSTSLPGCNLEIEVYDADGQAVSVEKSASPNCAGVRVTPAATSSHYILIKISAESHEEIDWALVYGYR